MGAGVKAAGGVKLTTHLHLVLRLRMVELYLHSAISLHGLVLNELGPGITLPFAFIIRDVSVKE
jgi:hypothetical protein